VDDEIVTVAKQRGTFQAALGSQVEHVHPINGHTPTDEIYALGEKNSKADQKLFEKRYFQNQK
jgi:fructose-1,6-bisphosphatase